MFSLTTRFQNDFSRVAVTRFHLLLKPVFGLLRSPRTTRLPLRALCVIRVLLSENAISKKCLEGRSCNGPADFFQARSFFAIFMPERLIDQTAHDYIACSTGHLLISRNRSAGSGFKKMCVLHQLQYNSFQSSYFSVHLRLTFCCRFLTHGGLYYALRCLANYFTSASRRPQWGHSDYF